MYRAFDLLRVASDEMAPRMPARSADLSQRDRRIQEKPQESATRPEPRQSCSSTSSDLDEQHVARDFRGALRGSTLPGKFESTRSIGSRSPTHWIATPRKTRITPLLPRQRPFGPPPCGCSGWHPGGIEARESPPRLPSIAVSKSWTHWNAIPVRAHQNIALEQRGTIGRRVGNHF